MNNIDVHPPQINMTVSPNYGLNRDNIKNDAGEFLYSKGKGKDEMDKFSSSTIEAKRLLNLGISIIPVREKADNYGPSKTPCIPSWKKYQSELIEEPVLYHFMEKNDTGAFAVVCGKISGNLAAVDVDTKYKIGCEIPLFNAIKENNTELYKKLLIHKTPSGGCHIIYRCITPVAGNQKLASRLATPEELAINPKTKSFTFIETRGEGGYLMHPPALGYSVFQPNDIPLLTTEEETWLLVCCRSFDEMPPLKKEVYTPTKREDDYYDENPFSHFDSECNPVELMEGFGWKVDKSNNHFIWFTRPGKDSGVSLSFNRDKRAFYCFTSSTELEPSKGYTPSGLVAALNFTNDKKRLYHWLIEKGYGKIKQKIEQKIARAAAVNGKPLPSNLSQSAKETYESTTAHLQEKYPFGVFWKYDSEEGIVINRYYLHKVADGMGYKRHNGELVRVNKTHIWHIKDAECFNTLKDYIKEEDEYTYQEIYNALDSFIERHGKFTLTQLQTISDELILKDTKDTSYKIYTNGILKIDKLGRNLINDVPLLIWKHSIQNRQYLIGDSGVYVDFLKKATQFDDQLFEIIGFLAHNYKDETTGFIIGVLEQCANPKDGGGAGKNVFCELFKYTTTIHNKPAATIKVVDEKLLQSWNNERLLILSDLPEGMDLEPFKEFATGGGLQKKLFKDERTLGVEEMPKIMFQSNYSVKQKPGLARRLKIIEFTDFFTKAKGIDVFYKKHFPNDWNADDWAGYDYIISTSIQKWIIAGLKIRDKELTGTGWEKRFEQTYGVNTHSLIKEYLPIWLNHKEGFVKNEVFKMHLETFFNTNGIAYQYRPSSQKINEALREYTEHNSIQFQNNVSHRFEDGSAKSKWFGTHLDTPF